MPCAQMQTQVRIQMGPRDGAFVAAAAAAAVREKEARSCLVRVAIESFRYPREARIACLMQYIECLVVVLVVAVVVVFLFLSFSFFFFLSFFPEKKRKQNQTQRHAQQLSPDCPARRALLRWQLAAAAVAAAALVQPRSPLAQQMSRTAPKSNDRRARRRRRCRRHPATTPLRPHLRCQCLLARPRRWHRRQTAIALSTDRYPRRPPPYKAHWRDPIRKGDLRRGKQESRQG